MKKLIFAVLAMFAFAACDKNSDAPKEPTKVRLIKSISYEYANSPSRNFAINFTYDDKGRLIIFGDENETTLSYSEDGKQINFVIKRPVLQGWIVLNCVYNLNDDGSVKNMYGGCELEYEWIYTNGYITESRVYGRYRSIDDLQEGTVVTKGTLAWNNSNLIAINSAVYYDPGEVHDPISESFEYSSLLNNYNFDLNMILLGEIFETVDVGWGMAVLFNSGTTSKNLAKSGQSVKENSEGERYSHFIATFTYTTNSDGYVTKAIITRDYISDGLIDDTITVNIAYY